ncbi:ABC transporter substrate-binding protein [Methylobacterium sp. NEAU 140]|uniref:ABC transporter substrate-binding protein n=1 Tax=Methylobacterium sp. NEAU 140 TaxID=3064945 RepID=UPI002735883A|nr:ABC transporter substrate-binding protein [Methylobacterium sp. NEAU 140]MDP4026155.1 ABC transporter substrate-binding protein [Methylobacterium sp. NEAU 140]
MRRLLGGLAGLALGAAAVAGSALAADVIKLGMIAPLTGGAAETGRYQMNGARLAVEQINKAGGLLGRAVELAIEDDQTTNPGAVNAFNRLANDSRVVAFLAPIRSTQVHAIAPAIARTAKPVAFGGTDPKLTRLKNPWLFRFRPNDEISAGAIVEFGTDVLQRKHWAIVHATDAFGTSSANLLVTALRGRGITPTTVQGFTTATQDFTPIVLAVKNSGADIMVSFATADTDQAILAKQLKQFGVELPWIGSASIVSATAMKLAGADLYGTYGLSDYAVEASPEATAFAGAYKAAYGAVPDFFASWAYDAVTVLAQAIKAANSTDPQAMRKALLETRGFKGAEGTYDFDADGDGLHSYNIVQNRDGTPTFVKRVEAK